METRQNYSSIKMDYKVLDHSCHKFSLRDLRDNEEKKGMSRNEWYVTVFVGLRLFKSCQHAHSIQVLIHLEHNCKRPDRNAQHALTMLNFGLDIPMVLVSQIGQSETFH